MMILIVRYLTNLYNSTETDTSTVDPTFRDQEEQIVVDKIINEGKSHSFGALSNTDKMNQSTKYGRKMRRFFTILS